MAQLFLSGCGKVESDTDQKSTETPPDDDDGTSGGGSNSGGEGPTHSTGGLPDPCLEGLSKPPPMNDVTTSYSEDPPPTAQGGVIPAPTTFVGVAKRVVAESGVKEVRGHYGLRFLSSTHVDYFFNDAQNRMTWRVQSLDGKVDNNLVLMRKCEPDGAFQYAFDYTYEDNTLTLIKRATALGVEEVYTFKRVDD